MAVRENGKKSRSASPLARSHHESRGLKTGMVADLMVFSTHGKIARDNKKEQRGGWQAKSNPVARKEI